MKNIKVSIKKLNLSENINSALYNGKLIQDPIGGTLRPDQLKALVIDDLRQCLGFAEGDRWEFVSLLNNIVLRVDTLKELYEDQDDRE